MLARFERGWRLVATALGFAVFGLCGSLFSVVLFPLLLLWPDRRARQRAVALLIHWFFRALVGALRASGVMSVDARGAERLRARQPTIVVANHPTYLDVMVLLSLTPRACCVVKNAHWSNPAFWGIVRAAGYISNADPAALIDACTRELEAGYTLLIFPEGTRSPARNRLHAFSRGFAYVALKTGAPVRPVLLHCDPPAFAKGMRWYQVPAKAFCIRVTVLDALDVGDCADAVLPHALAAREVTRAVETHITQHLADYGFFETGN